MKIGVIGSINVDLVYSLKQTLKKGETAIGSDFQELMGGKGANQAIMLSALHDEVVFLGAVGDDGFGEKSLRHFKQKGIATDFIQTKPENTGLAIIQIVEGDNSIAVIPGANMKITKQEVDVFLASNPNLELVVLQLEINLDAIEYLIQECKSRQIKVVLNPAPAQSLSQALIDNVDYLIPNEWEAQYLFGTNDYHALVVQNKGKLIVTMGSEGVLFYDGKEAILSPAQKINVVDTTGAGDSFVAGFAMGLAKKYRIEQAVKLGIEIASMTCESMGAQGAYDKVRSELYEKIRNS